MSIHSCIHIYAFRWRYKQGKKNLALVAGVWTREARLEKNEQKQSYYILTLQETHDPHRVLEGGGLMPLGGQEASGMDLRPIYAKCV